LISQIVQLATGGLKPELTLLFDVSIDDATTRTTRRKIATRDTRDRLDIEDTEFHTRVRDAYLKIAAAEPERVKMIDTSGPVERTHERVKQIIVPFLKARGHLNGD
jgi:dTMP kinase